MATAKKLVKEVEEMTSEEMSVENNVEELKEASKATEFSVYGPKEVYIRTYSLKIHGENAEALAHQFAKKINGTVK